jgi:hypothetical protein
LKHALEYAAEMGHIVESAFVTDLLTEQQVQKFPIFAKQ